MVDWRRGNVFFAHSRPRYAEHWKTSVCVVVRGEKYVYFLQIN